MGYVKQYLADLIYDASLQLYAVSGTGNFDLRRDEIEDTLWEMWEMHDPEVESVDELVEFFKEHYLD